MTNNILAFTGPQNARAEMPPSMLRDNIVSLDTWRNRARVRRTSSGVFFMTRTLCSPGDAA